MRNHLLIKFQHFNILQRIHLNIFQRLPYTAVSGVKCCKSKEFLFLSPARSFSWTAWPAILCTSTPVLKFQDYLIHFHDISGLPWWMVIMLTTFGIRTCLIFPLAVHQNQIISKLENLNHELGEMAPELNNEVTMAAKLYKWDLETSKRIFKKNMRNYYKKFVIRDNCHPFKCAVLLLCQLPAWICFSAALRNITYMMPFHDSAAEVIFSQLKCEGTLWFLDLTVPDMIIPVFFGVVNLTLIEMHALRKIAPGSRLQKILQNVLRCASMVMVVFAAISPSSVSFYWLCSSTLVLGQNMLLLFPKVRRILRIPITSSEATAPFSDIMRNLRIRLSK